MVTPDLLFSYWVFAWFVVWAVVRNQLSPGARRATDPFYALVFAAAVNAALAVRFVAQGRAQACAILVVATFLFKGVPLWILQCPVDASRPGAALATTCAVCAVYLLYLNARGTSAPRVYAQVDTSLAQGTNETPFAKFVEWII
jgi:hypothetical protein